jgi:hypothetical protein
MSRYPNIMVWLPEGGHHDDDDDGNGQCQLMGPIAIVVQMSLAAVALLALLIKRQREHPPRPFQIWYCRPSNNSKQTPNLT